jgi:hypothetical protein
MCCHQAKLLGGHVGNCFCIEYSARRLIFVLEIPCQALNPAGNIKYPRRATESPPTAWAGRTAKLGHQDRACAEVFEGFFT